MLKRVALGAFGVVVLAGAATATIALNEVGKLVDALGQTRAVDLAPKVLAPTARGAPETLLLVGNDQRPPPKSNPYGFVTPHSNEMLLVRIDPSKPTISMLSIPRELQVKIYPPGAPPVVNRINSAYTFGGIQLMTETIKRVLGVSVNHVFVVTFPKFKRAVNEMGCVYGTVDRRYYHVNEPGGEQYFEINLQPGYQHLCGKEALEFVANRHEDTSLTRDARDQRFLLEVKAQYGASLFESRDKFERVLGRAVETDLHGSSQVLDLLELLVSAQGKPVRQVPFHVNLLPTFDTATPQQIHESVRLFLSGTAPVSNHSVRRAVHSASTHRATHSRSSSGAAALGLSATPSASLAHARAIAPELPFPLEYPRLASTYAGASQEILRRYYVRDQHGLLHQIYVAVVNSGPLGEYYDVQGTTWTSPPLLSNPSQTVQIGSRTYGLFYTGEKIRVIAWREGDAVYWVQNTLTDSVGARQMLAIAQETRPVIGGTVTGASSSPTAAAEHNFTLPARSVGAPAGVAVTVGSVLAFACLAGLALLAWVVLTRERELRMLRHQVVEAMALESRQRPLLAAALPGLHGAEAVAAPAAGPDPPARASGVRVSAAADARPAGERRVYRVSRRPRLLAALAVVVIAAAAVTAGTGVFSKGSSHAPARSITVPVAVFNATGKPGAAHATAHTLRAGHIHLGAIGDIGSSLGPGTFVLYPPGAHSEAERVASLLAARSPTVAPIQPQVQSVIGRRNEIVVVLD